MSKRFCHQLKMPAAGRPRLGFSVQGLGQSFHVYSLHFWVNGSFPILSRCVFDTSEITSEPQGEHIRRDHFDNLSSIARVASRP